MAHDPKFQAFTLKSPGTLNRVITDIGVSAAFDPAAPPTPEPTLTGAKALWDTGATKSVISTELVKTLALQPVGVAKVNHAGGEGTSHTYLVNFRLPHAVGVAGILVTEFPSTPGDFGVIVGMDVICLGDFSLTNMDGKTWVSFRMPSCGTIDYVVEWNKERHTAVSWNSPCPCGAVKPDGSPVKFEQCHGR
jgi:hypothetical protein